MSEDTKQITFEGREYTVPVWVEWVALDEDWLLCFYEFKPFHGISSFGSVGRHMIVKLDNWRDSLTKV